VLAGCKGWRARRALSWVFRLDFLCSDCAELGMSKSVEIVGRKVCGELYSAKLMRFDNVKSGGEATRAVCR
jgi:hypothetical protein